MQIQHNPIQNFSIFFCRSLQTDTKIYMEIKFPHKGKAFNSQNNFEEE